MNTCTDPHRLAADGLVHYCGDLNPLDHDGYWYDSSQWAKNGYASAVEVICEPEGPDGGKHVTVSRIVINRPADLKPALDSCGTDEEWRGDVHAQIQAVKGYMGGEPDHSDWREPQTMSYIIPDDATDPQDCAEYARIHGATVADESEVWELLAGWVGRELHQG